MWSHQTSNYLTIRKWWTVWGSNPPERYSRNSALQMRRPLQAVPQPKLTVDAGAASESAARRYERHELPHTLPCVKVEMVGS